MSTRLLHAAWLVALVAVLGAFFPATYQPHFTVKLVALGVLALVSAVRLVLRTTSSPAAAPALPSSRATAFGVVAVALGPLLASLQPASAHLIAAAVTTSMLVCAVIVVVDVMNLDDDARATSARAVIALGGVEAVIAVCQRVNALRPSC